jgi:hypothetical protein
VLAPLRTKTEVISSLGMSADRTFQELRPECSPFTWLGSRISGMAISSRSTVLPRGAADTGISVAARVQPSDESARPSRAGPVPGMRSEGTSRRFDQVAAVDRVSRPSPRVRWRGRRLGATERGEGRSGASRRRRNPTPLFTRGLVRHETQARCDPTHRRSANRQPRITPFALASLP